MTVPDKQDLTLNLDVCPSCSHNIQNNYLILQNNPQVKMIKCEKCKLSYANKMPSQIFLDKLYEPSIYKANLTSNKNNTRFLAKKIFNKIKFTKNKIKILDFGGGNGSLSIELISLFEEMNISAHSLVVDVYNSCCSKNISFQHVDEFGKNQQKFDIVLASAVLEHLPNFVTTTNHLLNKLNNSGYFYCRTPWEYEISKTFRFYKIKWPRHLYDIGGDYWVNFFKKKEDFVMILNETSNSEISTNHIFKYFIAKFLKSISHIEKFLFRGKDYYQPKWPFVGGWDIIVRKNA
jgi:2-polyprenyl-3-methyl-5-hydroxy-6-metoxy-1,4-benzoquinol methylase